MFCKSFQNYRVAWCNPLDHRGCFGAMQPPLARLPKARLAVDYIGLAANLVLIGIRFTFCPQPTTTLLTFLALIEDLQFWLLFVEYRHFQKH